VNNAVNLQHAVRGGVMSEQRNQLAI